jgi:hypothetical protein
MMILPSYGFRDAKTGLHVKGKHAIPLLRKLD